MGFFDFLKKKQTSEVKTLNITAKGLEIDGVPLDLPTHISAANKLLGKPRGVTYKPNPETDKALGGAGVVSKRVNYAWDKLGLYCYTKNGTVLSAFGIRLTLKGGNFKHYPENIFAGKVTIEGKPWFEVMNSASDCDVFRKLVLGGYSIISEYVDFDAQPESRTAEDYTCIEIQLD